jgi:MerR family transcriptional regulator, mercuric resistance operon regulatory protein
LGGDDMKDEFAIGELARRVGVNIETIRYYERVGLIPLPRRTADGRRTYDQADAKRLSFVRRARELGFHLDDIRALLALRGPGNLCTDVKAIAERHLQQVRADLRRVMQVERILSDAVARCPGASTSDCTVLAILESAA